MHGNFHKGGGGGQARKFPVGEVIYQHCICVNSNYIWDQRDPQESFF